MPHRSTPHPAPGSVLVVDDEPSSLALAQTVLAGLGFQDIRLCPDAAAALAALQGQGGPADFVLCDLFMPEADGIAFLTALAERGYGGGVVLVSGGASQYLVIAKRIARFHGLRLLGSLAKPLQAEALARVLWGKAWA